MLRALQLLAHIEGNMLSSSSQLALPKETVLLHDNILAMGVCLSQLCDPNNVHKYTFMHIMGGRGEMKKKDPLSQYCSAATQALIEIWGLPCKHEKHFTVGVCTGFMCQGFGVCRGDYRSGLCVKRLGATPKLDTASSRQL